MSFLQAVQALGKLGVTSGQEDYQNFLQLPWPLPADENKVRAKASNYTIRVGLKVEDILADTLEVLDIGKIDCIPYPGEIAGERVREAYLYRKPVSSNTTWSFSPLYKLGKGVEAGKKELLGAGWSSDKNSRFYKLHRSVLRTFEKEGALAAGDVDKIMSALEERAEELANYWREKKSSYLLLFGVEDADGVFRFPGEVKAFLKYFQAKTLALFKDSDKKQGTSRCSLCFQPNIQPVTLDKVFAFSTFDKESFLPGSKNQDGSKDKVFPVCLTCYKELLTGQEKMENDFKDNRLIPGYELYVIPEPIGMDWEIADADSGLQDFLEHGIKVEEKPFALFARQTEKLTLHFLFAERNQAQQRIHYLVEGVSPAHLRKLQSLWQETSKPAESKEMEEKGRVTLDMAFYRISEVFMSLAGKTEQEQKIMRDQVLKIMVRLLNNDPVEVKGLKALMVSRLPGLLAGVGKIQAKSENVIARRIKLKRMCEVLEFFWRVNDSSRCRDEI